MYLQVALLLGRAVERRVFFALQNRAERLLRGRPRALLLLQAQLVERRAERHDDGAVEGVLRGVGGVRGALGEVRVGRLRIGDGGGHGIHGRELGRGGLLGANGHRKGVEGQCSFQAIYHR